MSDILKYLDSAARLSLKATEALAAGGPDAYAGLVVHGGGSLPGRELLSPLQPAELLTRPPARREAADALLAGLWLWHDWLDESHTLSQGISSNTGSFWHAIMHRREGDFSNARYWYARCGGHPAHARFLASAGRLQAPGSDQVIRRLGSGRDGCALVDLAEEAEAGSAEDPLRSLVIDLQRLEWAALFEETLRLA